MIELENRTRFTVQVMQKFINDESTSSQHYPKALNIFKRDVFKRIHQKFILKNLAVVERSSFKKIIFQEKFFISNEKVIEVIRRQRRIQVIRLKVINIPIAYTRDENHRAFVFKRK